VQRPQPGLSRSSSWDDAAESSGRSACKLDKNLPPIRRSFF
jgi:hypothetical protein